MAKLDEFRIIFEDTNAIPCNKVYGWRIGLAKVRLGLYYLPSTSPNDGKSSHCKTATLNSALEEEKVTLLHMQLGHPSFILWQTMYPQLFINLPIDKLYCDACRLTRSKRQSYLERDDRCLAPFQLIHFDVWGPSPHTNTNGYRWLLLCIDDHSRFCWLCLMKHKAR